MSVYALRDPRTGAVRYVGRSHSPEHRLRQHMQGRSPARPWCDELRALGLTPDMQILGPGTEADWIERLGPDLNKGPGSKRVRADEVTGWQNATEPIKVNLTESEWALIQEAAAAAGERIAGRWIRDVSLEVAREVIAAAEGGAPHGKRGGK